LRGVLITKLFLDIDKRHLFERGAYMGAYHKITPYLRLGAYLRLNRAFTVV